MDLKPFFSFYGGKWRAAPRYPAPEHPMIVEPFAGSAGYSVRYHDRKIRLVDADPIVVGVWDYLIHAKREEVSRLPIKIDHVDEIQGPQEARWLVGFWLNKGSAAPCSTPSAWMRGCLLDSPKRYPSGRAPGLGNFWGEKIRERIAAQVEVIRHWRAALGSYERIPAAPEDATWFIDPPYQSAGRHYCVNSIDYPHLAAWSIARQGLTIVCEQEGASWLPFQPFLLLKATSGKQKRATTSPEVIYVQRTNIL